MITCDIANMSDSSLAQLRRILSNSLTGLKARREVTTVMVTQAKSERTRYKNGRISCSVPHFDLSAVGAGAAEAVFVSVWVLAGAAVTGPLASLQAQRHRCWSVNEAQTRKRNTGKKEKKMHIASKAGDTREKYNTTSWMGWTRRTRRVWTF